MKKPRVLIEGHDFEFADDGTVILLTVIPSQNMPGPAATPVVIPIREEVTTVTTYVDVYDDETDSEIAARLMDIISRDIGNASRVV